VNAQTRLPRTCGELNGTECRLPIAHMGGHRTDSDYRPNTPVSADHIPASLRAMQDSAFASVRASLAADHSTSGNCDCYPQCAKAKAGK
jgi:hypothetical protein